MKDKECTNNCQNCSCGKKDKDQKESSDILQKRLEMDLMK